MPVHQGLIGRQRESEALQRLLSSDGPVLVTVTGPGGIGKTRLALHVADQVASAFEHGSAVVQLARNSFEAAFLDDATRARHLAELDAQGPL